MTGALRPVLLVAACVLVGCAERGQSALASPADSRGLVARLRTLAATEENENAIAAAAREQPDTLREALYRTFALQTSLAPPALSRELAIARRLADGYARAWGDSFLVHDVARFERRSPKQQLARVAADSLRREGIGILGREGVSAAMALWRQGLEHLAPDDSIPRAAMMATLGGGFYLAGDLDSATVYSSRARTLAARLGDRRTAGVATGILANISKDGGDLARAAELYGEASRIRAQSGDRRGIAADHNNLGLIARELGDLDESRRAFERALELNRADGRTRLVALNLTNLGDIAAIEGEYARADSLYGEALAINRADEDAAETGYVLHDLGLLAARRGQYPRARDFLVEALEVHTRSGAAFDAASVGHDLAAVQAAMGDLQGAFITLDRAARDADASSTMPALEASLALVRADLSLQLGAFAEADAAYAVAERLHRAARDEAGLADAQQGRALLLHLRGEYDRALSLLEAAARTRRATGDRRATALAELLIGQVRRESGDTAAARLTLIRARHMLRAAGDPVGEAVALDALGQLEARGGASLGAEQLYRRALGILPEGAAADVRWQLHFNLAEALRSRGAFDAAAEHLHAAVDVLERTGTGLRSEERRVGYLSDKWSVYASLALVERERGRTAESFAVSERLRARQLRDVLARGHVPTRREPTRREQDLRRRMTELLRAIESDASPISAGREARFSPVSREAAMEALARTQREYAVLLDELREHDPAYARLISAEAVSWSTVASVLRPDEVLLEYLITDASSTVFVVSADTIVALDLHVGRRSLASLVEFARRTMERPGTSPATSLWRAPLRRLHRQLIEPVAEQGLLDGKSRLVIVPHGELTFLNFGALLDGSSGDRFLIDRYELAYAPSATVWARLADRRRARRSGRILALAPRPSSLPGSRDEVAAIGRAHPRSTVLIGERATKRAFLTHARNHDVLHIASYGILNKHNPLFSFVELAPANGVDGRLEVHEVYGLGLSGQLVVLSACQTALGSGASSDTPPGDDWVGLVQAVLHAGASGVLASLWPVEDRATAELMRHFYLSLAAGKSDAAALADAQRTMLRRSDSAHPFYWSAFVLVGGERPH